jgi:hypothetical protein
MKHFLGLLRIVYMLLEIFMRSIAFDCVRRTSSSSTSNGPQLALYITIFAITCSLPALRTWVLEAAYDLVVLSRSLALERAWVVRYCLYT